MNINPESYRNQLDELELELYKKFSELLEKKNEFKFKDIEGLEYSDYDPNLGGELPLFDYINQNGSIREAYIYEVDKNGVHTINEDFEIKTIRFNDLASTRDRINLLDDMSEIL